MPAGRSTIGENACSAVQKRGQEQRESRTALPRSKKSAARKSRIGTGKRESGHSILAQHRSKPAGRSIQDRVLGFRPRCIQNREAEPRSAAKSAIGDAVQGKPLQASCMAGKAVSKAFCPVRQSPALPGLPGRPLSISVGCAEGRPRNAPPLPPLLPFLIRARLRPRRPFHTVFALIALPLRTKPPAAQSRAKCL